MRKEVQTFTDINVAWIAERLVDAGLANVKESEQRARAIFVPVAGAQLLARSRADISLFDGMISSYRTAGLLPA